MNTSQLLQQMVATIVAKVDPEQVILFGSHARGDTSEGSDVDLIVVESEPFGKNRDRGAEAVRLWQALARFEISKDILVYSRDEVEYWRDSLNHVLARVSREGKVFMGGPKLARVLLTAAERDIIALRGMEDTSIFVNEISGFHVQQAAEKPLEANLSLLGEPYPATHGSTR